MPRSWIVEPQEPVLVTGAGGFLGAKVAEILCEYGLRNIRCLIRSRVIPARLQRLVEAHPAELRIIQGNLLSAEDCLRAAEGTSLIFHLAAGTGKSFAGCFQDSAVATRNLLEAAGKTARLKRFVSISSLAVHSGFQMARGSLLDESSPVESDHRARFDAYCYGKIKQDELVTRYAKERGFPCTIVRPGPVYGPGKRALIGRLGVGLFGPFWHVGGGNRLPLIFLDNCAEAVVLAGLVEGLNGEVLIAVDDELPTSSEFLRLYKRNVRRFPSLRIPYGLFYFLCWLWERYSAWSQGQLPPLLNRWQCATYYQPQRYSNSKLKRLTGWKPRVPFAEASRQYFDFMRRAEGCP